MKSANGTVQMKFEITTPPSTNELYSNAPKVGRIKTQKYKAWISTISGELLIQRVKPQKSPVSIHVTVPKNNRRDLDNYLKPILDAMSGFKVIEGDTMKHVQHITIGASEGIQACIIEITTAKERDANE